MLVYPKKCGVVQFYFPNVMFTLGSETCRHATTFNEKSTCQGSAEPHVAALPRCCGSLNTIKINFKFKW